MTFFMCMLLHFANTQTSYPPYDSLIQRVILHAARFEHQPILMVGITAVAHEKFTKYTKATLPYISRNVCGWCDAMVCCDCILLLFQNYIKYIYTQHVVRPG